MKIENELYKILGNLIQSNTIYSLGRSEDEKISKLGYPRLEFEIFSISLNKDMSISNEYDNESLEIVDNYNRTAKYMIDITAIYSKDKSMDIDSLLKFLTNYYKLDRFFHLYDFSSSVIKDITINRDFKATDKSGFYLDQSIGRDGYTFTFDVELIDSDRIPAGIKMIRGEYNE